MALQNRSDFTFGLGFEKSGEDSQEPPLKGSSVRREGQTSPQNYDAATLEMRDLPENEQRQRPTLPWLRLPLDAVCRDDPKNTRTVELGGASTVDFKKEKKFQKPISPQERIGKDVDSSQGEKQREWKRKGQTNRRSWICAALAIHQLPAFSLGIDTVDCGDFGVQQWRNYATCLVKYQYFDGEHRAGGGPCSSISGSEPDAQGRARSNRSHAIPDNTFNHEGFACGDEQPWEGQEDVVGNHRSETSSQRSLDATSSGLSGAVEQTTTGLHPTTSSPGREGEQGYPRYPVSQQGDPSFESTSGRRRQQNVTTACRDDSIYTNGCPNQERPGNSRPPAEAAEGLSELLGSHRYQDPQRNRGDPRVRRRWRREPQETKISRASQRASRTGRPRCHHVKRGRVPRRHVLSMGHKRPPRPSFYPVAEAYDDNGGRCAARWGLEPVITFSLQDFIFPQRQCLPPPNGPLHETHIFAEELQAQRIAIQLRSTVLQEDNNRLYRRHSREES